MNTEEKPRAPKESQKTSLEEAQEAPEEIESESPGCDGSDSHNWANKMEVQRHLSGKPDLKIVEKRTVLFVDDDETMLRSIERCLLDEPYNQLFAKSGQEALEILQKEEVHVIVTDMRMPGMDGPELLRIVKEMYPHIVKIVLSGYADQDTVQQTIDQVDSIKIIPKSWNQEDNFKKFILEAIDRYNLQSEIEAVR